MTRILKTTIPRAYMVLAECNPQAVVLDRSEVAWQKWSRHWRPADGGDDKRTDYELALLCPVKVIHEGVKP